MANQTIAIFEIPYATDVEIWSELKKLDKFMWKGESLRCRSHRAEVIVPREHKDHLEFVADYYGASIEIL